MVKIVEPPKSMKTICHRCRATLEYDMTEVKNKTEEDYTGGKGTVYFIVCPACNKNTNVKGYYHD